MPNAAIVNPPSAGPIARLTLELVLLIATALSRSSLATSIGVTSNHVGAASAPAAPRAKVVASRAAGVARRKDTTAAKAIEIALTASCAPSKRRRASTMSANAPAGRVSRNIGKEVAIWTADTIIGLGLRLVINQLAEVSNIAMPTFDSELAIRMTVKAELPNTPQGELTLGDGSGPVMDSLDKWAPPRRRPRDARDARWRTRP